MMNLSKAREKVIAAMDPEEFVDRLGLSTEELFDNLTEAFLDRIDRFDDVIDDGRVEYGYDYEQD